MFTQRYTAVLAAMPHSLPVRRLLLCACERAISCMLLRVSVVIHAGSRVFLEHSGTERGHAASQGVLPPCHASACSQAAVVCL